MGKEEEEEAQEGRKGSRVHSSKKRRGAVLWRKSGVGGRGKAASLVFLSPPPSLCLSLLLSPLLAPQLCVRECVSPPPSSLPPSHVGDRREAPHGV